MMRRLTTDKSNSKETFHVIKRGDVEYYDPSIKFLEDRLILNKQLRKKGLIKAFPQYSEYEIDKLIYFKTLEQQIYENKELLNIKLPEGLLKILAQETKKEQVRSLKNISLSHKQMKAFILRAYSEHGFRYSTYSFEHHHKGLAENHIPFFYFKDGNGKIHTTSDTNMTKGELKQMIESRKVIVSHFLDKDEKWHCFFLTIKSIKGKEYAYKNGQPHLHYISYTFGISRDKVLNEFKSEKYKLSAALHIDYVQ